MPIKQCRVCGHDFFNKPLLQYENMPAGAQYLPDASQLKQDRGIQLEVHQCAGCGLVQLNGDPVPYYREVIRAAAFSPEMKEFRLGQFSDFVKHFSLRGKKAIEVGCGRGEYLTLMEQSGVDAYGLEFLEDSVDHCRRQGLKVSRGFIEDSQTKLKNAPFDVFFILNFFEHLPDPNQTLIGIYNNLSDGAIGLVEVPNFDMMVRNKLFSEFISDHLFYFTKDTLKTTLQYNGFEILECKEIWHDYILSALIKKKKDVDAMPAVIAKPKRLDLRDFDQCQRRLKCDLEGFIHQFGEKKVAIWGAGHQALAVLSLTGISDKIRYVIDSAPFKQGKYTPATHVPIVAPEVLRSDPVEAVIIMAASYSDEVARIIRMNYDQAIKVCLLHNFSLKMV